MKFGRTSSAPEECDGVDANCDHLPDTQLITIVGAGTYDGPDA